MRKQYTYDSQLHSGDAILVIERGTDDEHKIGMTRNTTYFFNCEQGERYEVFKAHQVGNMDAWLGGGNVEDLPDADTT